MNRSLRISPFGKITELIKIGQSRALPLRPIGKTAENKNNGIDQIHDYSQMDIILRVCVGATLRGRPLGYEMKIEPKRQ